LKNIDAGKITFTKNENKDLKVLKEFRHTNNKSKIGD